MKNLFTKLLHAGLIALLAFPTITAAEAPRSSTFLDIYHIHDTLATYTRINAALGTLGATNAISKPVALFETSLNSSITSAATSMTLVSGATKDGINLASSTYAFIIDEGKAGQEFVKADCTSTVCTNMQRGISVITGTTTVSSLPQPHNRGASVKITDAPILLQISSIVNGADVFPNPVKYLSTIATTTLALDRSTLASVGLVQDIAFNGAGVINASQTAKGIVEIATQIETASSTSAGGSGATLAIPASNATSTYNPATAPLRVVVTQNNGTIDSNFISSTTIAVPPAGTLSTYISTTTIPGGYLRADGQAVSSTTYPYLFTQLGTTYGSTATTFNVPARLPAIDVSNLYGLKLTSGGSSYAYNNAPSANLAITGDISMSAWINQITPNGSQEIISRFAPTNGDHSYRFEITAGKTLTLGLSSSGTGETDLSTTPTNMASTTTGWNHLAVSYVASTGIATFYINGAVVGTVSGGPASIHSNSQPLSIGSQIISTGTYGGFFSGFMANVKIFNKAISQTEVIDSMSYFNTTNTQGSWTFNNTYQDTTGNATTLTASSTVFSMGSSTMPNMGSINLIKY